MDLIYNLSISIAIILWCNHEIQSANTFKAEMSALENSGRLPASAYEGATMYTTLSPCDMCTGACILYKVKRVVIGENQSFMGGEELLKNRGKEVVVLDNQECKDLMGNFMKEKPELWYVISALFTKQRSLVLGLGIFMIIITNCSVCTGTRISLSNFIRPTYIIALYPENEQTHNPKGGCAFRSHIVFYIEEAIQT
jgi:hypothetical protein